VEPHNEQELQSKLQCVCVCVCVLSTYSCFSIIRMTIIAEDDGDPERWTNTVSVRTFTHMHVFDFS